LESGELQYFAEMIAFSLTVTYKIRFSSQRPKGNHVNLSDKVTILGFSWYSRIFSLLRWTHRICWRVRCVTRFLVRVFAGVPEADEPVAAATIDFAEFVSWREEKSASCKAPAMDESELVVWDCGGASVFCFSVNKSVAKLSSAFQTKAKEVCFCCFFLGGEGGGGY
jgi:hypothetical protein